jgi:hypothetical protein
MSVIERPERAPDRMWRCPNCGRPCGRAGHITERCDGKSIEYVRADIHLGAVEALARVRRYAESLQDKPRSTAQFIGREIVRVIDNPARGGQ